MGCFSILQQGSPVVGAVVSSGQPRGDLRILWATACVLAGAQPVGPDVGSPVQTPDSAARVRAARRD